MACKYIHYYAWECLMYEIKKKKNKNCLQTLHLCQQRRCDKIGIDFKEILTEIPVNDNKGAVQ